MNQLQLLVKKLHPDAVLPAAQKPGDAGLDLTAVSVSSTGDTNTYDFGIAVELPPGHFGLIVPRSSNYKKDQLLSNSCGIVDENYRGPLKAMFKNVNSGYVRHEVGERIAQLIVLPYPVVQVKEVEELSETVRGSKAFGSSGSK